MRAFALLMLATACRITGTFECGIDDACRRGDDLGMCEVEGYCSFGDDECPSGRRYADNAGDGLADQCVADTAEPLTCLDRWRMNVAHFAAVSDLGVSSPMDDRDPWISPPGTVLLFSSTRTGGAGADIYTASRPDTTAAFGTPAAVAALNSSSSESRVSISSDGLTIYMNSNRMGTRGGMDIWRATRTTPTGTFSTPDQATVESVNTGDDEHDVQLSADGLRLYFALGRTGMPQRIATASRATTADPFGAASTIVELDAGSGDADPAVSADELLMVFTSLRTAELAGSNLWYTTRARVTEKWLPPRLVPDINIDGDEGDAFLTPDGCTLLFSRRPSETAPYDLVYATMIQ